MQAVISHGRSPRLLSHKLNFGRWGFAVFPGWVPDDEPLNVYGHVVFTLVSSFSGVTEYPDVKIICCCNENTNAEYSGDRPGDVHFPSKLLISRSKNLFGSAPGFHAGSAARKSIFHMIQHSYFSYFCKSELLVE